MKVIVYETLNRQGRITQEGDRYVMYMRNDFTGRYNKTSTHRRYPVTDKMFNILRQWIDRNLQDRPQGAFMEESP